MKGMRFKSSDSALGFSNLIKTGLKSNNFKQQWDDYCEKCGHGITDPTKHSSEFHINFLEYVSQRSATLSDMERESFKAMMQGSIAAANDGDRGGPLTLPVGLMGLDLGARTLI